MNSWSLATQSGKPACGILIGDETLSQGAVEDEVRKSPGRQFMEGSGFEPMHGSDLFPVRLLARHVIGEAQLLGGCVRDSEVLGYAGEHVPPAECVYVCDVEVLVASVLRQSCPRRCAGAQPGVGD